MNTNWKWVYNPFERIAGWNAFGIGLIILCIATIIGYFGNTVFFGISIKTVRSVTWGQACFLQASGLAILVLMMWVTALLSAKHVRFQDILGTVTLAKYPLVLAATFYGLLSKRLIEITDMFLTATNIQEIIEITHKLTLADYALFTVLTLFSILVLVWTIALLYNAFRVSANLKGVKCALLFSTALLISEILINVTIFLLNIQPEL